MALPSFELQPSDDPEPKITVTAHVPSWIKDRAPMWVLVGFAAYFVWFMTSPMLKAIESMTAAVNLVVDVVRIHDMETKHLQDQSRLLGERVVTYLQIQCLNDADDAKKRTKCVTGEMWAQGEPWP